ncbi:MAG: cytochrome c family protein, partial [Pseudomonadota bacterium]
DGGITDVAPDPIEPLVAAASAEAGEAASKVCKACHTFDEGGANRVGPNLHGVVGRDIGAVEGFAYSDILKTLPGAWGYEELDAYLLNPKAAAPGNKMAFAGIRKAEDRAAVIAYLRSISPNAPPLE